MDEQVPVRLRRDPVSVKLDVQVGLHVLVRVYEREGWVGVWLGDARLGVSDWVWVCEAVQVCVGAPVVLSVGEEVRRGVWVGSLGVWEQVGESVVVSDRVRLRVWARLWDPVGLAVSVPEGGEPGWR